jgi:hypothetical protein
LIVDEVSMLHRDVMAYAEKTLKELWPRDHPRYQLPFGGTPVLLTGNWAQLKPVVRRGDDAACREASVKRMPLFVNNFHEFQLRVNRRVGPGEERHAEWLDKLGRGQNYANDDYTHVRIPDEYKCETGEQLIEFVFPRAMLADPLANVDYLRNGAILAPHRVTVATQNSVVVDRMPTDWVDLLGFDHLRQGGERPAAWDVNAADADIENIHQLAPSGFPAYKLRVKVGAICVVLNNYDSKAGLFNGTRVQILGLVGDNLLRVRILDGRGSQVGQTYLMARAKFVYGEEPSERGIPFSREQFPLDLGHALTNNKGQGQTYQRTGCWLYDSQVFSDGMFYTACSRSTSAAGLKIFSGLGDMALNKVDFELLGVRPRIAEEPTVQPVQQNPAPLLTPQRSPRVEPMDLTRTPRPSLTEDAMELGSVPPTPQTVVSVMDWAETPEQGENNAEPGEAEAIQPPLTDPGAPGATDPPANNPTTDSGGSSASLYRRL